MEPPDLKVHKQPNQCSTPKFMLSPQKSSTKPSKLPSSLLKTKKRESLLPLFLDVCNITLIVPPLPQLLKKQVTCQMTRTYTHLQISNLLSYCHHISHASPT
jgi:hypothetical protein